MRINLLKFFILPVKVVNHSRLLRNHQACLFELLLRFVDLVHVLRSVPTDLFVQLVTVQLCFSHRLLRVGKALLDINMLALELSQLGL